MINVKPIDGEVMEQWPVESAGLPQRVMNSCTSAGIHTVGELRRLPAKELKSMRGIGAGSVRAVENFFEICDQISQNRKAFANLKAVFDALLKKEQHEILTLRYGLDNPDYAASRKHTTLQAIGSKHKVCRERVRQMENKAKNALSTRLAQACLQQVYDEYEAFIKSRSGVASPADIATLGDGPVFEGYNPCSVLLLLSDCRGYPHYHSGFFTTLPIDRIKRIETQAVDFLKTRGYPQSLSTMLDVLSDPSVSADPKAREDITRCTLNHFPLISATTDDRYFLPGLGTEHVVREVMEKLAQPAHFRTILREFNKLMIPGSRKGPGHILDVLQGSDRLSRTSSGYYKLRDNRTSHPGTGKV
jgi:hypothetical protein